MISHVFRCLKCVRNTQWTMQDAVDKGLPVCLECDGDMQLDTGEVLKLEKFMKDLIVSLLDSEQGINLEAWMVLQELMVVILGVDHAHRIAVFVRGTDNAFYVKGVDVEALKEILNKQDKVEST